MPMRSGRPRFAVWNGLAGQLAAGFALVSVTTIGIMVIALDRLTGAAFTEYVRHVDAMRGFMGISTPMPDPAEFTDSVRGSLLLAGAVGTALSVLAGILVARLVTRPVRLVERATDRIADGDLTVRIPLQGTAELRHLVAAFNTMSEALHASSESRKQFMASVTHELRTPLAVLQAEIEAIQDGILEPDPPHVEGLAEEVRLIGRLVGDLQVLAVAEAGELRLERAPQEMKQLLTQAASAMADLAAARDVHIVVDVDEGIPPIFADAMRIRQVLGNLLVNAIRYSPQGANVRLSAAEAGDRITVSVEDEGPGIVGEDLARVFDRFFRSSSSTSREGTGLGLAIVRELVQAHGGIVAAFSPVTGGARFVFTLPIAVVPIEPRDRVLPAVAS